MDTLWDTLFSLSQLWWNPIEGNFGLPSGVEVGGQKWLL